MDIVIDDSVLMEWSCGLIVSELVSDLEKALCEAGDFSAVVIDRKVASKNMDKSYFEKEEDPWSPLSNITLQDGKVFFHEYSDANCGVAMTISAVLSKLQSMNLSGDEPIYGWSTSADKFTPMHIVELNSIKRRAYFDAGF